MRGNRNSGIYHLPNCPDYEKIGFRNRVSFRTEEEARQNGFRKARNCPWTSHSGFNGRSVR